MELYTLVSLLIGVFGGSFAAINNLRSLLDSDFNRIVSEANEKSQALVSIAGDGHRATSDCTSHCNKVNWCRVAWRYVSIGQAFVFLIIIYYIVAIAVLQWEDIVKPHTSEELSSLQNTMPWKTFPWILGISASVNFVAVVSILAAFWYARRMLKNIVTLGEYTKPPNGVKPA